MEQDLPATSSQFSLSIALFVLVQGFAPIAWSAISEVKGRKVCIDYNPPEYERIKNAVGIFTVFGPHYLRLYSRCPESERWAVSHVLIGYIRF